MNTIEQLTTRLGEISARQTAIIADADKEDAKRDLTQEEQVELDNLGQEFETVEEDLARRKRIAAHAERAGAPAGRKTTPAAPPAQGMQNTHRETEVEKGRWGFSHMGEYLSAVVAAKVRNQIDPRLVRGAATTWGNEGVGEDGGFAVPPDWRTTILSAVLSEDNLLSRTDQQTTSSNMIVVPVDEKAAWHQNGVRAYWLDEAAVKTQSRPQLSQLTVRANKLAALVYLTDELLEDAPSMARFVQTKAPEAINWEVNDAIINGNGAGKPLGILNSPALVTVAAEGSQAADTVNAYNILKMYGRMPDAWRRRAVWLVNQDLEPLLAQMTILIKNVAGTENVGGFPVYMPPGGISSSPYGTLMGRPVITSEAMSAVGDVGDIVLADLSGYMTVLKAGGIRTDVSIHVEFERDMTAFRFVLRIGGQPWLSAPIARKSGTNTFSHFVTLAAR